MDFIYTTSRNHWSDVEYQDFLQWRSSLFLLPGDTWSEQDRERFTICLAQDKELLVYIASLGGGRLSAQDAEDLLMEYCDKGLIHYYKNYKPTLPNGRKSRSGESFLRFCLQRFVQRRLQHRNHGEIPPDDFEILDPDPLIDPSKRFEKFEINTICRDILHKHLEKYPADYRLIVMRIDEELPYNTIATRLNKNTSAVKTDFHRVRQRLRGTVCNMLLQILDNTYPLSKQVIELTILNDQPDALAAQKLGINVNLVRVARYFGLLWLRHLWPGDESTTNKPDTTRLLQQIFTLSVMPADYHLTPQECTDYLYGDFSEIQLQRIDRHLITCEECCRQLLVNSRS